jgi:hypothetical protein
VFHVFLPLDFDACFGQYLQIEAHGMGTNELLAGFIQATTGRPDGYLRTDLPDNHVTWWLA